MFLKFKVKKNKSTKKKKKTRLPQSRDSGQTEVIVTLKSTLANSGKQTAL